MKKHKSLNKDSRKVDYPMKKRGVIELVAWLLILLTTAGIGFVILNSTVLYIGDTVSQKYVNYYKCNDWVENLEKNNVIIFQSKKEAEKNFEAIEGCV